MKFLLAGFRGTSFPRCDRPLRHHPTAPAPWDPGIDRVRQIFAERPSFRGTASTDHASSREGMLVERGAEEQRMYRRVRPNSRRNAELLTTDCPRCAAELSPRVN